MVNSPLLELLGIDPAIIFGVLLLLIIILLIMLIVAMVKIGNTNRRLDSFMRGKDAESLEEKLHIPSEILTGLIFILIRACVHYALFEDEFYLKAQLSVLKESLNMYLRKYGS